MLVDEHWHGVCGLWIDENVARCVVFRMSGAYSWTMLQRAENPVGPKQGL